MPPRSELAPIVVAVTGLPGTGKSTLADAIARKLVVPAFAGDWLLGALKPVASALVNVDRATQLQTYNGLLKSLLVRQAILGQSAIVDALVTDDVAADWQSATAEHGASFAVIECTCSDERLHRQRIEGRVRGIPGWHEVGWDHVARMAAEFAPLTCDRLVVDAVEPVESNLAAVLGYVERS